MTDAIFREAIIIKKKHSDFFPISELPILPFHMWFGFRISSPFHLDVLVHPVPWYCAIFDLHVLQKKKSFCHHPWRIFSSQSEFFWDPPIVHSGYPCKMCIPAELWSVQNKLVPSFRLTAHSSNSFGVNVGVFDASLSMHRLHDILQFFETSLKNRIVKNWNTLFKTSHR